MITCWNCGVFYPASRFRAENLNKRVRPYQCDECKADLRKKVTNAESDLPEADNKQTHWEYDADFAVE